MIKKISLNSVKLIKYYKFINHNLIYNNKAINRYKKDNFEISADKADNLSRLKKSISQIKNCTLKDSATNLVFSDGNPKSNIDRVDYSNDSPTMSPKGQLSFSQSSGMADFSCWPAAL